MHLLALAVFIAFINLGLWQLRRLDARQEQNISVQARSEEAPLNGSQLENLQNQARQDLEFRAVRLQGEFIETDRESTVRNRTLNGRPGVWVLTPFRIADTEEVVVINRGWIPREFSSTQCRDEAGQEQESLNAPSGEVVITGILRESEGSSSSREWKQCLQRVELEGFSDLTRFPFWIQITEDIQRQAQQPLLLDSPDRGSGPHLSYAVQWFIFSAILAGGYPLILIRQARR